MRRGAFLVFVVVLACSAGEISKAKQLPVTSGAAMLPRRTPPQLRSAAPFGDRLAAEARRFQRSGEQWIGVHRTAGLRIAVGARGAAVSPRARSWTVTVATVAIGRAGRMRALPRSAPHQGACDRDAGPAMTGGCVRRLEIDRGAGVVETWRHAASGLEQGFEIARRPAGRGPLAIEVRFTGATEARLEGEALLVRADGREVLRYGGLAAWDAKGRVLPARLSWGSRTATLTIDDRTARYPVTVDPLLDTPGWTAESDQEDARFGSAVAGAGDVDGDGYGDVIVGAPFFDAGETDEGRVFVFRGSADGLEDAASWTAESDQDYFDWGPSSYGASVSTAGDVNADGYDDVIVGAYNYTNGEQGEGRAYVYLGSDTGLEALPQWTAEGNQEWSEYGWSVGAAGDVNGDGYDDVIVASRNMDTAQSYAGRVFVFYGSDSGVEAAAAWSAQSNVNSAHFGESVAGAGDVNGDGYDDVIVTQEGAPEGVYVFLGSAGGLEAVASWSVPLGGSGWSVDAAGDVNGDGFDDVIGGWGGGTYVYLGSADGLGADPVWTAQTDQDSIFFGWSVSGAGDVNGDGYDDVVVGQYDYIDPEVGEGRAFLYYGSPDGPGLEAGWIAESNQDGAEMGWSVSGAGDVDADGYDDVIVGAPFFTNGELSEGRAFLFRGQVDDGTPCDGGVYHDGACDATHCYADGLWTLNGETNPADPCQVCEVATSQVQWSPAADLGDCDGGLCRAGVCEAQCSVRGQWYDDGAGNPEDDCQTCDVGTNPRAWSDAEDGRPCADGLCNAGRCDAAECFVRGAWTVNADTNPANECEVCDVASSRTEWTNAADGASCEGGVCRDGSCQDDRCYIDGAWYVDGAVDPANPCQACDVTQSRVRWTADASGACSGADGGPSDGDDDDGGCSCRAAGTSRRGAASPFAAGATALLALVLARRRRRG